MSKEYFYVYHVNYISRLTPLLLKICITLTQCNKNCLGFTKCYPRGFPYVMLILQYDVRRYYLAVDRSPAKRPLLMLVPPSVLRSLAACSALR